MGVRILEDRSGAVNLACLYCSTSDVAFGPVFYGYDAHDQAVHFLDWLDEDARSYSDGMLRAEHATWAGHYLDDRGDLTAAAAARVVELL